MEIKLTSDPRIQDLEKLQKTAEWIQAERSILVSQTTRVIGDTARMSCDLITFLADLEKITTSGNAASR